MPVQHLASPRYGGGAHPAPRTRAPLQRRPLRPISSPERSPFSLNSLPLPYAQRNPRSGVRPRCQHLHGGGGGPAPHGHPRHIPPPAAGMGPRHGPRARAGGAPHAAGWGRAPGMPEGDAQRVGRWAGGRRAGGCAPTPLQPPKLPIPRRFPFSPDAETGAQPRRCCRRAGRMRGRPGGRGPAFSGERSGRRCRPHSALPPGAAATRDRRPPPPRRARALSRSAISRRPAPP